MRMGAAGGSTAGGFLEMANSCGEVEDEGTRAAGREAGAGGERSLSSGVGGIKG